MSLVLFLNKLFMLPKLLPFSWNTQTYRATNWPVSLATTHNETVSGESAADEDYILWYNWIKLTSVNALINILKSSKVKILNVTLRSDTKRSTKIPEKQETVDLIHHQKQNQEKHTSSLGSQTQETLSSRSKALIWGKEDKESLGGSG